MSSERPPPVGVAPPNDDALVIDVQGLGKAYHVYEQPRDRLKQMLSMGRRRYYREFWALRGIDLQVRRGQTVGIIGRNGSGKSTLLQVICGTLQPSEGRVAVDGRIAALLELGAGFNPEYTGRDNVYLYGSVLGMDRPSIDAKLQQILDFAEIGEFIDLPVKTYSSGMYVRLAFSVAINVDPDILVVDEALAVGDGRFQHRCMARIRQLQQSGVSILYVSHDTEGVKRLCDHVVVLQDGRIVNQGAPLHMSNWYLALMTADYDLGKLREIEAAAQARDAESDGADGADRAISVSRPQDAGPLAIAQADQAAAPLPAFDPAEFTYFRHGDGRARILDIHAVGADGQRTGIAYLGDTVTIRMTVEFLDDQADYLIGLLVRDRLGTDIIALNSFQERITLPPAARGERFVYTWRFPLDIRPGHYSLCPNVAYDQYRHEWLDYIDNATILRVADREVSRIVFGVCLPSVRMLDSRKLSSQTGVLADAPDPR
jgi:ABC-type polysaccharide/polyol phosphate transport system ATPase subunit